MPIHYGSQIEEHHGVRRDAGMFDVSHMTVVDLTARGCAISCASCWPTTWRGSRARQGAVHLHAAAERRRDRRSDRLFPVGDFFRLVVNAATRDKDLAWIAKQAAAFEVAVKRAPDFAMIAVQGPNARQRRGGCCSPAQRAAALELASSSAAPIDSLVRRAHRLHRRGRLRDHDAGSGSRGRSGSAARRGREAGGTRRTRHPATGSRHEPLRQGHG